MTTVTPPKITELENFERQKWHRTFDPHFDTLVSVGYIDGCYPLSYGSSLEGAANSDGEVTFSGTTTFLDYPAALSASTVYIVSSSASDTQDYVVQGIDANGDYQTATVTATGTTPAAVSGTWNHVQRLICTTGVDNVGSVYISTDAGAIPTTIGDQIQLVMIPGENYAINPELVVPNDQIFTIHNFDFSQDVKQTATVRIYANRQGRWIINFKFYVGNEDSFEQTFHTPLRLFAGDRMRVSFEAGGAGAASASFGMNGNVWDTRNLDSELAGIGEIMK